MSFPSIENFDVSIISRTKHNLENYQDKYEFTMLLNSLLGLLIIPNECAVTEYSGKKRKFSFDFLEKNILYFKEIKNIFSQKSFVHIRDGREVNDEKMTWTSSKGKGKTLEDITLGQILRRMRNGVAHFGFEPLKTDGTWSGIVISNVKDKKLNFRIHLTETELRTFALFIANKYEQNFEK